MAETREFLEGQAPRAQAAVGDPAAAAGAAEPAAPAAAAAQQPAVEGSQKRGRDDADGNAAGSADAKRQAVDATGQEAAPGAGVAGAGGSTDGDARVDAEPEDDDDDDDENVEWE